MSSTGRSVAIVGGGLSGLTAAFDLAGAGVEVTVFEAGSRFGGKIWSSDVGGFDVDAGPDTFLARVPHGRALVDDLGLSSELVSPIAPVPAYLHRDGKLAPLPAGTVLGVPTDLDALRASGLVSEAGVERAREDLTRPATPIDDTTTVGAFCRDRLGPEVTERLIDPMVGGINASDIDTLSLRLGAPQLAMAAAGASSLIEGLRAARATVGATLGSAGSAEPVFFGLRGGMAALVSTLVDRLETMGANLHLDHPISDLDAIIDRHDAVVVATEAHRAASLTQTVSTEASRALAAIRHASVSQVTVRFDIDQVEPNLDASGILFPRPDGFVLTAATWFSSKWERYRQLGDITIRLTSGRFNDERAGALSDADLTATLLSEIGSVIRIDGDPLAIRVVRWRDAFPQYEPGHADRCATARAALFSARPGTYLIGNSYDGIGIPAAIAAARRTARQIIEG